MRYLFAVMSLSVLGVTPAFADATAGPGMCATADKGCGCTEEFCNPALPPDMSIPRDLAAPRDLSSPSDGSLDACRERVRKRNRAHGRGLVLLSGASALVVFALRRRYKTMRPTPAENALAASETRSDS